MELKTLSTGLLDQIRAYMNSQTKDEDSWNEDLTLDACNGCDIIQQVLSEYTGEDSR